MGPLCPLGDSFYAPIHLGLVSFLSKGLDLSLCSLHRRVHKIYILHWTPGVQQGTLKSPVSWGKNRLANNHNTVGNACTKKDSLISSVDGETWNFGLENSSAKGMGEKDT
jgi:hypothetical protein